MTQRSCTIGRGKRVDIRLDQHPLVVWHATNHHQHNNRRRNYRHHHRTFDDGVEHCVSEHHACIFYDDAANTYELINYSVHGTLVDECLYDLSGDDNDNDNDNDDDEGDDQDQDNEGDRGDTADDDGESEDDNSRGGPHMKNGNASSRRLGESAAVLRHGSRITIGCFSFVFVIIDYDLIEYELERGQLDASLLVQQRHRHLQQQRRAAKRKCSALDSVLVHATQNGSSSSSAAAASASKKRHITNGASKKAAHNENGRREQQQQQV